MRAVVQRVRQASVAVGGRTISEIGPGALVLVGVSARDGAAQASWLAEKVAALRIFPDAADAMNRSLLDAGGDVLVVSQFTLYGDARRGRRPSFVEAARGEAAEPVYRALCERLRALGLRVAEGAFGARMEVASVNDGPVTILLDSDKAF
jgi:D-tyrosyl-tRNA(Tyr) deacylase